MIAPTIYMLILTYTVVMDEDMVFYEKERGDGSKA